MEVVIKRMRKLAKHFDLLEEEQQRNAQNVNVSSTRWNIERSASGTGGKLLCLHVTPHHSKADSEQFNLIRKCLPLSLVRKYHSKLLANKHFQNSLSKQSSTSTVSELSQNYSKLSSNTAQNEAPESVFELPRYRPIIKRVKPPSNKDTTSQSTSRTIDHVNEHSSLSSQNSDNSSPTEEILPSEEIQQSTPSSVSKSDRSTPRYMNLYEYQTNPKSQIKAVENENETERLDQSSSEYFAVEQSPSDNSIQENIVVNVEEDKRERTPILSGSERGVKDLWQVSRRKKQLRLDVNNNVKSPSSINLESDQSYGAISSSVEHHDEQSKRSHVPKLLMRKRNRPAMYSLNGFVPKPSMHRVASSLNELQRRSSVSFGERRNGRQKSKQNRRNKWRKHSSEEEDHENEEDEIQVSESISHHHRRRTHNGNSLSPSTSSVSSNQKRRRLGAATHAFSGKPWPSLNSIPKTNFECGEKRSNAVYADPETGCQVWHVCQNGSMHSFLCPIGTIFNVKNRVCDWWYNTRCLEQRR